MKAHRPNRVAPKGEDIQKLDSVLRLLKPGFREYVESKFTQAEVDEIVSEACHAISHDAESKAAMIHELAPWIVAAILGRDGFVQVI